MRSIGIDIGAYGVKVVDLLVTNRSIEIKDVFEVPLNSDPAYHKRIPSLEILQEIAANIDPGKTKVVFAIQQQHVTLRHKVFPFRERAKILKSLPFELEDDIPFNQESAIFESKILRFQKTGAEVIAFATPNEFVAELINYGHDASIDPDILSCEAAALSTLFEDWSAPPRVHDVEVASQEGTSTELSFHPDAGKILLHIGHERSVLCAFHNGILLASRTLFFGGLNIVRSIQKQYNIPYAEALKGFTEKGFILNSPEGASHDQVAFSQAISVALNEFVEDVRRSVLEIQTDFKVRIGHIDVSGGVSPLPNLCTYLTQCFEIPCNLLRPFATLGRTEIADSLGARCTIALGLALEGARRPINPAVNFRKGAFSKENLSLKLFWQKWSYAAKLAGIAVAALYVFAFIRDPLAIGLLDASNALVRNKAQEAGLKRGQNGPSQLRRFVQDQDKEIKRRKSLNQLQDINSAMSVMNKLSLLAPPKARTKLDVRRFYVFNDLLTVEGDVARREELVSFQQSLTSLSTNRQLTDLTPTLPPRPGRIAFAYQVKVQRKGRL